MAHDVFISHSVKDKATADALCAKLESRGLRCWIAPRDILPGKEWGASLVQAIAGAKAMVLVFSDHANQSPQIRREVERAVHHGVPVVPFRIEDVLPSGALEYFLSAPHWLDALTPPLEQHLDRLADALERLVEVDAAADRAGEADTGAPAADPGRAGAAAAGAAAGLAAGAALAGAPEGATEGEETGGAAAAPAAPVAPPPWAVRGRRSAAAGTPATAGPPAAPGPPATPSSSLPPTSGPASPPPAGAPSSDLATAAAASPGETSRGVPPLVLLAILVGSVAFGAVLTPLLLDEPEIDPEDAALAFAPELDAEEAGADPGSGALPDPAAATPPGNAAGVQRSAGGQREPTTAVAEPAPVEPTVEAAPPPPPTPWFQETFVCSEEVEFHVSPEEAIVTVDGRRLGPADDWDGMGGGEEWRPGYGTYYARFTLPGHRVAQVRIIVRAGAEEETCDVDTDLEEIDG